MYFLDGKVDNIYFVTFGFERDRGRVALFDLGFGLVFETLKALELPSLRGPDVGRRAVEPEAYPKHRLQDLLR